MDYETHLLCENIQNITLQAFPMLYEVSDHNGAALLKEFRLWGEEFEKWWWEHDLDWIDSADYIGEISKFTDKKVAEYLAKLNRVQS